MVGQVVEVFMETCIIANLVIIACEFGIKAYTGVRHIREKGIYGSMYRLPVLHL